MISGRDNTNNKVIHIYNLLYRGRLGGVVVMIKKNFANNCKGDILGLLAPFREIA